ncbi:unnamed protein product [Tilletia caries]|nr:unnamed protein product [Tilletia caries]
MNPADQAMVDYMQFYIDRIDPSMGPNYELAKTFGQQLIDNCKEAMVASARYKEVHDPTALHTKIDARGNIVYTEAKRIGVRKLEAYIKEMAVGTRIGPQINVEKARENIGELWMLIKNEPSMSKLSKATLKTRRTSTTTARPTSVDVFRMPDDRQPFLNIQRKFAGKLQASQKLTFVLLQSSRGDGQQWHNLQGPKYFAAFLGFAATLRLPTGPPRTRHAPDCPRWRCHAPLPARYCSHSRERILEMRTPCSHNKKKLHLTNNGWFWAADPLSDFASPQSRV